ncbi:hypothetical protein [Auritidibacter ignavus]|uniref:hypothetical protein n=1 Tax=Auritidibacter ignavus TaxID=678932 RepID=UPI002446DAAD|nr:hypothetical protein [Auritidibacter ignavus]WGH87100.1 hypothetical protein QDX24_04695 [Auritidibacter ignavus]WGH89384.1 hypothetical protein QDX22_04690 [Auritidibacter ignavus]
MTHPTAHDILQDQRLDGLEGLVKPAYDPPDAPERSFPVVGQGIDSRQYQQMSRAAGTGVFVQSEPGSAQSPYRLVGMPGGDSETNAKNQMMLRTSNATGRSEAAIEGFFHTQLEDMPVSFPPVTTPTTYYLALTYDPRREEEEAGPISVEVHANKLPTTHGRKHIVLYTIRRSPNQLLSDATITQTRPWLGHVINVWSYQMLPDPERTEYGTLACVVIPRSARDTGPELYTNRGVHGWVPIYKETKYAPARFMNGWSNYTGGGGYGDVQFTLINNVVHVSGMMSPGHWSTGRDIMQLRNDVIPSSTKVMSATHGHGGTVSMEIKRDGYIRIRHLNGQLSSWVALDGISYTLD